MFHLVLHILIPLLVAVVFCRPRWRSAFVIMMATMLVDLDHLLANPIYDPNRCSIDFHPLHTSPLIFIYALMFLIPLFLRFKEDKDRMSAYQRLLHFVGLGLIIHMILDGIDCL